MINICRKAFFYEQLKLVKSSFFEVPLKEYGGDTNKGSILDKKVSTTNPQLERIKQFGPTWSWMALSPEAKAQEWELDAGG